MNFDPYPRICFIDFRERGEGGGGAGERKINVRNVNWLPPACSQLGIIHATYVCALTED